jgi:hypothetical protein
MSTKQEVNTFWYKPVPKTAYDAIKEHDRGVEFVVRILPDLVVKDGKVVGSTNPITSKVPFGQYKTEKWFAPVLVISDPLTPSNNNKIGVMEFTKTLHKKLTSEKAPEDFYRVKGGTNFHIRVKIDVFKDSGDEYPNYGFSGFAKEKSDVDPKLVIAGMKEGGFYEFSKFAAEVNDNLEKRNQSDNENKKSKPNTKKASFAKPAPEAPIDPDDVDSTDSGGGDFDDVFCVQDSKVDDEIPF